MYPSWMMRLIVAAIPIPWSALAQQACPNGIHIDGAVTDPTGAVIPGAQVQAASGERTTTDAAGNYVLPCVAAASATITAQANGFKSASQQARGHARETVQVNLQLVIDAVETDVQVNADSA